MTRNASSIVASGLITARPIMASPAVRASIAWPNRATSSDVLDI